MSCQDHLYRNTDRRRAVARRWFLEQCGVGLGAIALGELLEARLCRAAGSIRLGGCRSPPRRRTSPPRPSASSSCSWPAAPSHLELFDNKPQLAKFDGTLPPAELLKGYRAAFINPNSKLLGPKFKFAKHGQCGAELSELLPHLASVVDDIAIVKSMVTDAFNHAPGQILMSTGSQQFGRPSIGAWTTLRPGQRIAGPARLRRLQHRQEGPERRQFELGQRLPADRLPGRPVPQQRRSRCCILSNPAGVDAELQRDSLDAVQALNRMRLDDVGDPEIATRINSFEMAFRMQAERPELMDIAREPQAHPRDVRRRAGQAVVRQQLPAGPPAGRARRPVRADLPRGVGPARQPGPATSRRTARTPTRPARPWSRT